MLSKLSQSELVQAALWLCAFGAVCALVGIGKLKPETVELMLMALFGASTPFGSKGFVHPERGRSDAQSP